jgi:CDP-glucose 4,6-dehydratase
MINNLFDNIYKNKTVLVTGHTGFKGSWLVFWLYKMGANIIGYSLKPPTNPNHFEILDIQKHITSIIGDIRDKPKLQETFTRYKPDIVFHLAAQPLVRESYENPFETYEINVMGTLNIFEMCKNHNVKAIVNITTDKCYENKEWIYGYRENEPLGGYDPYSSSKACSEILTSSFRNSFFNLNEYKTTHNTLLASCRAGNVIGGGDWAKDRLVTDIVLSTLNNKKIQIRNPKATRPWQFVLEPLSGYLLVGQKLLQEQKNFATSWNFGPKDDGNINVINIIKRFQKYWDKIDYSIDTNAHPHEATFLKLDCSKAEFYLKWLPNWDIEKTLQQTILWYKDYYETNNINTLKNFNLYIEDARNKGIIWATK